MRRNMLLLLFFVICLATISTVSATSEKVTQFELVNVNHYEEGDFAQVEIDGNLYNYDDYEMGYGNPIEYEDVNLKIEDETYTEQTDSDGHFYFRVPSPGGNIRYTLSYSGNSYYEPASYSDSYYIPDRSTYLNVNTKLGIKKIIVTAKLLTDYDPNYEYFDEYYPLYGKTIKVYMAGKNYYAKTNSDGYATISIPSSTGYKKLSITFPGYGLYTKKTVSKSLSISSYSIISKKILKTKFVKYFEKRNKRYKKYKRYTKYYYFNGTSKIITKYIYKFVNSFRTVKFSNRSSHRIVKYYPGYYNYLEVYKYSYLREIGIYDYIDYDERYLDYFKIYYKNGKIKKVKCYHYFSRFWIFSDRGVYKIKFYFS